MASVGGSSRVLVGDCRDTLQQLPDGSVHCVVTSPPYWSLRTYDTDTHNDGLIGLEPTFDEHINNLLAVFKQVRRVLRPDGTVWLNYGDAYSSGSGLVNWAASGGPVRGVERRAVDVALPPKNQMMMPARVAMALQNDGWILRKEIIWEKPNPLPESVKDRPTSSHEKVFLFAQQPRYFYDDVAVRSRTNTDTQSPHEPAPLEGWDTEQSPDHVTSSNGVTAAALRDVWTIPTAPFPGAHFATFPTRLVEPCIKAGTSEHGVCAVCGAPWLRQTEIGHIKNRPSAGHDPRSRGEDRRAEGSGQHGWKGNNLLAVHTTLGWEPGCGCDSERVPATVLDPFGGAGTVAVVAHQLGRDAVLCELSQSYAELSAARITGDAPMLNNTEIVSGAVSKEVGE